MKALIFDCDGVIAETEKDGHRVSFNRAFQKEGIQVDWSTDEYRELLQTAGGKERMKVYFSRHPELLPDGKLNDEIIRSLHKRKTEIFMEMSRKGELPVRPGVRRLIREAHERGLILAVCSTSNEMSVETLIRSSVGEKEFSWFQAVFAGDMVRMKKPAPDVYNLVPKKFGIRPEECFVVEDNRIGLMAAKNAMMYCMITVSYYSMGEDLGEADLVASSLGDPGVAITILQQNPAVDRNVGMITLDVLEEIMKKGGA